MIIVCLSGNGNGNGNGEEIQDDLRCKPDKTVCEKHYIQAKKRAASLASKANQKKLKTEETDTPPNIQQQAQMCLQSLWGKIAINAREKIEIQLFLASIAIKEPSAILVYRHSTRRYQSKKLRKFALCAVVCVIANIVCVLIIQIVLPVIKQIHVEQCAEVELEKRLRGADIDLVGRTYVLWGCKACDLRNPDLSDREESSENSVYSLWLDTVKSNGVANFEKQWAEGWPVIVKRVLDE
ncbi:unnamed protein product [Cochlearia groenlandica]